MTDLDRILGAFEGLPDFSEGEPMTTTPGPRTEPRTEAGRAMLYDWQKRRTHPPTEARQESYRQFILAIEAEARADVDRLVAHPGEPHEFRTTCRRCGEPGQLHIALLGPDEGYSIGPLGDKAEAPE